MIEQVKVQYGPLVKALEKQTKTNKGKVDKHVQAIEEHSKQLFKSNESQSIKDIISEQKVNEDAKNKLNQIIEIEKSIDRKKLILKQKISHLVLKTLEQ